MHANWDRVIEGFLRDGRIGHSHVQVPGHDGKLGFGGSCFKDVQALIKFSDEKGIDLPVLKVLGVQILSKQRETRSFSKEERSQTIMNNNARIKQ